ncbi:MAG: hypothetical protein FJY17_08945 [Bacteroidetes bacterium]|nr:hypothetical protein [Bacteroidota bacterium]
MKKVMTIFGVILFASIILTGCGNSNSKQNDLGIVSGKIETYFDVDTSFADQKLTVYPKFNIDSLHYRPYIIGFEYAKEYDEKEAKWKLTFGVAHYDKYVFVYPSKGILKIDDYEINYESVMTYEQGSEKNTIFAYGTLIAEADIINKLAAAKTVKFTALGHDKQEFIWSPKIIEDAKNTLKYFDSLKATKPTIK